MLQAGPRTRPASAEWTTRAILAAHRRARKAALGRMGSSLGDLYVPRRPAKARPPSGDDDALSAELRRAAAETTHLSLQAHGICALERSALAPFATLKVLYLYDNRLDSLEALRPCAATLERLYVQDNGVTDLSPLAGFTALQILDVSGNAVACIAGLGELPALQELHADRQQLGPDGALCFDTDSCHFSALRVLTAAGSRVHTVRPLAACPSLCTLLLADNCVHDVSDVVAVLGACSRLATIDLSNNPVAASPRFRETLIVRRPQLESVNDRPVAPAERAFLLSWSAHRHGSRRAPLAGSAPRGPRLPPIAGARPPQMAASRLGSLAGFRGGAHHAPVPLDEPRAGTSDSESAGGMLDAVFEPDLE